MRTIGQTIKILRSERHLSQEKFAKLLNVVPSAVGMWENDKRIPNEETKEAICDYFNVDMNFLYGKTNIRNSYREGNGVIFNSIVQDLELASWMGTLLNNDNEQLYKLLKIISQLSEDKVGTLLVMAEALDK